eukprot:9492049-Pyramimonas_sp.AAC.1
MGVAKSGAGRPLSGPFPPLALELHLQAVRRSVEYQRRQRRQVSDTFLQTRLGNSVPAMEE